MKKIINILFGLMAILTFPAVVSGACNGPGYGTVRFVITGENYLIGGQTYQFECTTYVGYSDDAKIEHPTEGDYSWTIPTGFTLAPEVGQTQPMSNGKSYIRLVAPTTATSDTLYCEAFCNGYSSSSSVGFPVSVTEFNGDAKIIEVPDYLFMSATYWTPIKFLIYDDDRYVSLSDIVSVKAILHYDNQTKEITTQYIAALNETPPTGENPWADVFECYINPADYGNLSVDSPVGYTDEAYFTIEIEYTNSEENSPIGTLTAQHMTDGEKFILGDKRIFAVDAMPAGTASARYADCGRNSSVLPNATVYKPSNSTCDNIVSVEGTIDYSGTSGGTVPTQGNSVTRAYGDHFDTRVVAKDSSGNDIERKYWINNIRPRSLYSVNGGAVTEEPIFEDTTKAFQEYITDGYHLSSKIVVPNGQENWGYFALKRSSLRVGAYLVVSYGGKYAGLPSGAMAMDLRKNRARVTMACDPFDYEISGTVTRSDSSPFIPVLGAELGLLTAIVPEAGIAVAFVQGAYQIATAFDSTETLAISSSTPDHYSALIRIMKIETTLDTPLDQVTPVQQQAIRVSSAGGDDDQDFTLNTSAETYGVGSLLSVFLDASVSVKMSSKDTAHKLWEGKTGEAHVKIVQNGEHKNEVMYFVNEVN